MSTIFALLLSFLKSVKSVKTLSDIATVIGDGAMVAKKADCLNTILRLNLSDYEYTKARCSLSYGLEKSKVKLGDQIGWNCSLVVGNVNSLILSDPVVARGYMSWKMVLADKVSVSEIPLDKNFAQTVAAEHVANIRKECDRFIKASNLLSRNSDDLKAKIAKAMINRICTKVCNFAETDSQKAEVKAICEEWKKNF